MCGSECVTPGISTARCAEKHTQSPQIHLLKRIYLMSANRSNLVEDRPDMADTVEPHIFVRTIKQPPTRPVTLIRIATGNFSGAERLPKK